MMVSLAWVLAVFAEVLSLALAVAVWEWSRFINRGRVPYTDKRDAAGIAAFGTAMAVLLVISHYTMTW